MFSASEDFEALASSNITFSPTQTSATVTFAIVNDTVLEGLEQLTVEVVATAGQERVDVGDAANIFISDDDCEKNSSSLIFFLPCLPEPVCLSVSLSVSMSVCCLSCLFVHISIYLSIYLLIYSSDHLFICLFISLLIQVLSLFYPSVQFFPILLSVPLHFSVSLSLSVFLSVCQLVYLPVSSSFHFCLNLSVHYL